MKRHGAQEKAPLGWKIGRGLGDAIAAHPGFDHRKPLNAREGQRTIKGPLTWTESRLALGNTVRHAPVRSGTEFSAIFGQKHF
jgi:hypothetical protein